MGPICIAGGASAYGGGGCTIGVTGITAYIRASSLLLLVNNGVPDGGAAFDV